MEVILNTLLIVLGLTISTIAGIGLSNLLR